MQRRRSVVYGSFPTSNHNTVYSASNVAQLFMGLFLHQTTTCRCSGLNSCSCLWVFSYIKPQQGEATLTLKTSCLWVFSYIKPQQGWHRIGCINVVYGSFPTSNHNSVSPTPSQSTVVYGSFPTSNHNVFTVG